MSEVRFAHGVKEGKKIERQNTREAQTRAKSRHTRFDCKPLFSIAQHSITRAASGA